MNTVETQARYKIHFPEYGLCMGLYALTPNERENITWSPMVYADGHREGTIYINNKPFAIEEVQIENIY